MMFSKLSGPPTLTRKLIVGGSTAIASLAAAIGVRSDIWQVLNTQKMTMRPFLVHSALATAFAVAITTLPIDQANAGMKRVGSYSTNALRRACSGAGGTFATGQNGEHSCTKGGNIIDCNGKNQCIGGTPRRGGTPVRGGPITTGKAQTSFVQGAPKALAVRATRVGGTLATRAAPPRSAATVRPCARHHC